MSKHRHHRYHRKALIAVLVILAYAWLLPATVVMAASASSGFTVTIEVIDTVAIETGREWIELAPHAENSDLLSGFVTRAASSQLETNMAMENEHVEVGLPLGNVSDDGRNGDAAGSGMHMVITATRL